MAKGRKVTANYFVLVNPLLAIFTVVIVAFLVVTYVDHKLINPEIFGPLSEYAAILANQYKLYFKIGLLVLVALHLVESLLAVYKCYRLRLNTLVTIAWTLQTLLFGILSLRLLLWPQKAGPPLPQQKLKQQGGGKQKKQGDGKQNNKQGKQQPSPQAKVSKSKKEK